ncbi:MAG: acyltransferase family protein [Hyphomonas sp.]|uniref:acyltransferase family protein n=1 Tax=Hyphomonas sp. TaxID=87 RepID=UPI0035280E16
MQPGDAASVLPGNDSASGRGKGRGHPAGRRVDIDLLRAVAVLAVILFHFDVPGLSGGFLGVDMFFVISGYLITLHIRQKLDAGNFSFVNFYARRIRRLFPALAATLVLTGIGAVLLLPAALLQNFAHSAIASSAYVSNVYFWSIADYFDTDSVYKPLLHTWSLSVEEQFYIFWPMAVLLFHRRYLTLVIALAGIVSLLGGMYPGFSPTTVFYHFPFRVHEFAIGALVSGISFARLPRPVGAVLVAAAIPAIAWGLVATDGHSAFPGWGSGAVILGTALMIAVSHPLLNRDWMVFRPFLRIGLISYSAYLVHWPLVVFYKISRPGPLNAPEIAVLLGVTLVLAEILYRLVEQPASKVKLPRFRYAIIAMAPVMLIGALGFNQAYPVIRQQMATHQPAGTEVATVAQVLDGIQDRRAVRDLAEQEIREKATGVLAADRKVIAVLGDSHAVDVSLALRLALGDDHANVVLIHSICDPLTLDSITVSMDELYKSHSQDKTREEGYCYPQHADLLNKVEQAAPDLVIFSEAWRPDALPYLGKTLEDIKAAVPAQILVLGRVPQFMGSPDVIFRDADTLQQVNQFAWNRRYKTFDDLDTLLSSMAGEAGVAFISKWDLVCPDDLCDMVIGSELGYTDAQHWSLAGMKLYGGRLGADPVFRQALSE